MIALASIDVVSLRFVVLDYFLSRLRLRLRFPLIILHSPLCTLRSSLAFPGDGNCALWKRIACSHKSVILMRVIKLQASCQLPVASWQCRAGQANKMQLICSSRLQQSLKPPQMSFEASFEACTNHAEHTPNKIEIRAHDCHPSSVSVSVSNAECSGDPLSCWLHFAHFD